MKTLTTVLRNEVVYVADAQFDWDVFDPPAEVSTMLQIRPVQSWPEAIIMKMAPGSQGAEANLHFGPLEERPSSFLVPLFDGVLFSRSFAWTIESGGRRLAEIRVSGTKRVPLKMFAEPEDLREYYGVPSAVFFTLSRDSDVMLADETC